MKWISNNDPPLYVWFGDVWYNQKDRIQYNADIHNRLWWMLSDRFHEIPFLKKTRIMN